MLNRRIWGSLCLALLAGALPTACGDEITQVVPVGPEAGTGEEGESCSAPTDCAEELRCIRGVCLPPDPAILGAAGESCSSNFDCAAELRCIANLCTDPASAEDGGSQVGPGKRGESCETRSDCETGLTCIQGTCTIEEFGLEPTEKRCTSAECLTPADCAQHVSCESWESLCDSDPVTYETYCNNFALYCTPDNWSCATGECVYIAACEGLSDCPNLLTCSADSKCVECEIAADCASGSDCIDSKCTPTCEDNRDCPYFHECDAEAKTCVEVGCATDRECVAYTDNALAKCVDTECVVPCQTDGECANPYNYNFQACVEGYCAKVGCETDEECRIYSSNLGISACLAP